MNLKSIGDLDKNLNGLISILMLINKGLNSLWTNNKRGL